MNYILVGPSVIKHSFVVVCFEFKSREVKLLIQNWVIVMKCKVWFLNWVEGRNHALEKTQTHFHFSLVTNSLEEELFQKTLGLALCKQSLNLGSQWPLGSGFRPDPHPDLGVRILFSTIRCLFKSQFFLHCCWGIEEFLSSPLKGNLTVEGKTQNNCFQ